MKVAAVTPQRVLVDQADTLLFTTYSDGTATDQGTFTIGIVDANGDTVVSAGTAVTDNADGTYSYSLAAQSEPNVLTVTLTESGGNPIYKTTIEVVGSLLFNEYEARNKTVSGQQTPLSSTSDYSDAFLLEWHDRIADLFEQKTGRSWINRYARVEMQGTGALSLNLAEGTCRTSTGKRLRRPGRLLDVTNLISVKVNGTAQSVSDYVIDGSRIYSTNGVWLLPTFSNPLNVTIEYEYGVEDDLEAKENALRLLLANAVPSDIPGWASTWTNEDGSFTRNEAGFAYPTKVWEWLRRNDARYPVM